MRFASALLAVTIDLVFYLIWVKMSDFVNSGTDMLEILYLHLSIACVAASISYYAERSMRNDFLLQFDFACQQENIQEIIDNIMPSYITRKLRKLEEKEASDRNLDPKDQEQPPSPRVNRLKTQKRVKNTLLGEVNDAVRCFFFFGRVCGSTNRSSFRKRRVSTESEQ